MTATKTPVFVHCGGCSHEWAFAYVPMHTDLLVKLGKAQLCPMCGSKQVLVGPLQKPTPEGDAEAWLRNGDTGISSRTIWRVMMGRESTSSWENDVPHDPGDFGRCYRLLQVMPSWRPRLAEVAAKYPAWAPFVEAWDELTEMFEAEERRGWKRPHRLFKRMEELECRSD